MERYTTTTEDGPSKIRKQYFEQFWSYLYDHELANMAKQNKLRKLNDIPSRYEIVEQYKRMNISRKNDDENGIDIAVVFGKEFLSSHIFDLHKADSDWFYETWGGAPPKLGEEVRLPEGILDFIAELFWNSIDMDFFATPKLKGVPFEPFDHPQIEKKGDVIVDLKFESDHVRVKPGDIKKEYKALVAMNQSHAIENYLTDNNYEEKIPQRYFMQKKRES